MYSFMGGTLRDETKTAARETKYSTTYGRVPFEAPETLPAGEASVFKVGIRRRIHEELLG